LKRRGRHPSHALSGDFISSVRVPGLYPDGNGLYLRVDYAGRKRWILRTVVRGKRRDMGLGSWSLVEARARARRLRIIAREGGDPFAAKERVFNAVHPEVTAAAHETLELLRKAGVAIDEAILTTRSD
jgi:hypothetical protein